MKKIILATAIAGTAFIATGAHAELKLDLGGYFRGYAVYTDDQDQPAGAANDLKNFDFRRDTEIHFTGETTLDNGLTVGFHDEMALGAINGINDATQATDEVYAYFSGAWGRINFGVEDGAAYLLQVAAPSADSNVDGLRTYIQALNVPGSSILTLGTSAAVMTQNPVALDYDNAPFRQTDRITYLTPKFNGLQAGVSYAPEAGENDITNNIAGQQPDDTLAEPKNLWEASLRWDGQYQDFGISLGGGYSGATIERVVGIGFGSSDDYKSWDLGADVSYQGFSLGAAYLHDNNAANGVDNIDNTKTWVVGTAWDQGPYHVGASYLHQRADGQGVFAGGPLGDDDVTHRYTVGGGYTFGPGMTFRGAVAFGNGDAGTAALDQDFTQVTLGTDIQF